MEKRMKLKVHSLVRSSLNSCRPRDLYDVVETCTHTSLNTSSEALTKAQTKTSPSPRRRPPPLSPFFPPNPFYEDSRSFRKAKSEKKKKKKRSSSQFGSDTFLSCRFKSSGSWCWSCSEEEEIDDTETLFSSRSFSSESSESFAVVKKSEDPYEDFRISMVEMIVERQIFAAAQLQELLQCFLSLNSRQHHNVIVQVFLEIYATLFSP